MFHNFNSRRETEMPEKKDKRIVQTEQAILDAGIRTLLANRGAGMSEIAQAAGIGRATLYRHFKTREDLIRKLALNCYAEFDAAFAPHLHLEGKAAIQKVFELAMSMAHRFSFLIQRWSLFEDDKELQRVDAQSHDEISHLLDQAKAAGDIDRNLPNAWLIAVFDSLLAAGCTLIDSGDANAQQAADYATRSFFAGCGRPAEH